MSILLIKGLIMGVQILLIGRFHLECSKINGFSQPTLTIRKVTNPIVMPVKRLIPFLWAKKGASILIAFLVTFLTLLVVFSGNVSAALMTGFILLVSTWISFLKYGMFLFIIGSWIQHPSLQKINYFLYHLFEPMLRPIRQILPSFSGLDFSPIVFFLLLMFAERTFFSVVQNWLSV